MNKYSTYKALRNYISDALKSWSGIKINEITLSANIELSNHKETVKSENFLNNYLLMRYNKFYVNIMLTNN